MRATNGLTPFRRFLRAFSHSRLVLLCVLGVLMPTLGGCGGNFAPSAFPSEFSDAARQTATSVADQTRWGDVLARLSGQVIEPGVETYAGILYVAGAKLPGTSGQIGLEAAGKGGGELSDEARAVILKLANNPKLLELISEQMQGAAKSEGDAGAGGAGVEAAEPTSP